MSKRVGVALATGVLALIGVGVSASLSSAASATPGVTPSSAAPSGSPSESPSGSPSESPSPAPSEPQIISADDAKAIALAASGGGTITKFEFKAHDGRRPEFRVEIRNGRLEHRIRIDAYTGEITRHDIKD